MSLRSAVVLLAVSLAPLAACVPDGPDPDPKGSIGLQPFPSPATRGRAFTTSDGWSVEIQTLVFVSVVTASATGREEPAEETYLWNAMASEPLLVRAVPAGSASVTAVLRPPGRRFDENGVEVAPYRNLGVSPVLDARLRALAFPGPSLYVVARAERDGRVVTLDAPVVTPAPRPDDPDLNALDVFVRTDDVVFVRLEIRAEAMFPRFDAIAATSDGNGRVTAAEVRTDEVFTLVP